MSKFVTSLIAGDTSLPGLAIQAGESIEMDLAWKNADGGTRSEIGATVAVKIYLMPERKLQYSATLGNPLLLSIPGATTLGWPTRRSYHCEVWETAADGTVQNGHFGLTVGD